MAVRTANTSANGHGIAEGVAHTLDQAQGQAVAIHENQQGVVWTSDVAQSLNKGGGKPGQGYPAIQQGYAVRRLTPLECERLQGFPDGLTDVPYRGKQAADGPRYKAIGNSMAVNVMRFIGERIACVD
jgi:DNA (cytosine-5)-methyltransferase 1